MPDTKPAALVALGPGVSPEAVDVLLRARGFVPTWLGSTAEAQGLLAATSSLGVMVLDLAQPGLDALLLVQEARRAFPREYLPILVLAPPEDRRERLLALRLGADAVLDRDLALEELEAGLQRVEALRRLLHEQGPGPQTFALRLEDEFRRAQRYDSPLSLVLFAVDLAPDVPSFPAVTSEQVEAVLHKGLRGTDVLVPHGEGCHALLLTATPVSGALTVAERLWKALDGLAPKVVMPAPCRAWAGVATCPHRAVPSPEALVRAAQTALERAKREPSGGHPIRLAHDGA